MKVGELFGMDVYEADFSWGLGDRYALFIHPGGRWEIVDWDDGNESYRTR